MALFEASSWSALDAATATSALPAWAAATLVLAGLLALVFGRRRGLVGTLARLVVGIVAGVLLLMVVGRSQLDERAAERRALEVRASELATRALAQGSALACLDGLAGEAVENACERAVFARPEVTAAAVAYIAARLALLADATRYAQREPGYEPALAGLRRAVELDRYGIAAHVLATRDGCTVEQCDAFAWVSEAGALKANLRERVFDKYIARHAETWSEPASPAVAEDKPPPASTAPVANAPAKPTVHFDYPSAASIPPVSIMNAEPPLPPIAAAPSAGGEEKKLPIPPRRPQTQAATPP